MSLCPFAPFPQRRSAHFQHTSHRRITRSTTREQSIPTTFFDELFDELDDETGTGGTLRMTEDERRSVVIDGIKLEVHLAAEVDIIDGERVVGFHSPHAIDT